MNTHPILTAINDLQKEARSKSEAISLASKFCPDTEIARVLNNVSDAFLFFDASLIGIRSQVEALLDKANSDLLEDIEGPGD